MAAAAAKIGILTFHRCINYGSYWQARCLIEGLRGRGFDAELLDHECEAVRRAEWRCTFQPALPARTPRSDFPLYKRKGRSFACAIDRLPLSARFSLNDPAALSGYEAIVVGSDEVWNFRHPWYGSKPIFFGSGLNADRLVSYAASFGNHDADEGIHPEWAGRLRAFTALSVRDENSRRLVRSGLGAEPELVLDPCLQFPSAAAGRAEPEEEPFVLVYGHGFPAWFQEGVRSWSRDSGLRLVSVGYRNDWADEQRIDAGPCDFANLMSGARAVATNFFHGCVFALLNAKPFISAPTPYRFNKVRDLTAALGAGRHLVTEASTRSDYGDLLQAPLDAAIGRRVAELRAQSNAFLDAALS